MADADDTADTPSTWLGLVQSVIGALLLIAYIVWPAALAIEVPFWPAGLLAYVVIGHQVGRFERFASAIERVLERTEKVVKAVRGFDPTSRKL